MGYVSQDEIETAVENASSIETLRNNLLNLQGKTGYHDQLFDQDIREIAHTLKEIEESCKNGSQFHSLDPLFQKLPQSLVQRKAVQLASQFYDSEYDVVIQSGSRHIKQI